VTEAEQPKGIEVVKDCIRKLKLDQEIRRAEGGKTPKVSQNLNHVYDLSLSSLRSLYENSLVEEWMNNLNLQ
jgi:hypothetical protein